MKYILSCPYADDDNSVVEGGTLLKKGNSEVSQGFSGNWICTQSVWS